MHLYDLVLAGIVPDSTRLTDPEHVRGVRENIEYSLSNLKDDYFDGPHKKLFQLANRLFQRNQAFIDRDLINAAITANVWTSEDSLAVQTIYNAVQAEEIKPDKFKHLVDALKKEKCREILTDGMTQAMEKNLTGDLNKAKDVLKSVLTEIEHGDSEAQPAMEVSEAANLVINDYYQTKAAPTANRVYSGFNAIDVVSKGWQPGELILCGAFTGHGKSQFALNVAYHNKIESRKNVLIFSLEMSVVHLARRLVSRHSCHSKFRADIEDGLEYNSIKNGSLAPREEKFLQEVQNDFKDPNYGKIEIIQMPRGATMDDIATKSAMYASRQPVDLIIIDYITLVSPSRSRLQMREEVSEVVKDTKQLALSFNKGKGVPVLALSQISRLEYAKALKLGEYTITSFAESSELERSSDMCLWLLRRKEEEIARELRGGIVKYRDNSCADVFTLSERFSHALMENSKASAHLHAAIG